MGFDIYGSSPKSEKGKYFRNSVWWWRPLAEFVLEHCDVPVSVDYKQTIFCNGEL